MTVDTQELLATRGSIAPLSPSRLQEIRDRAFRRMDDRATRGQHIHITANEAIELVAAAQALNDAQAKFDAQAAEIAEAKGQVEHLDRQNNALREAIAGLRAALQPLADTDLTKELPADLPWFVLRARAALSGEPT